MTATGMLAAATMDIAGALLVLVAGLLGGMVNAVVGSGTLIVYPMLLAAGLGPVAANATNTMGLSAGSTAAAAAYRDELRGRMRQLWPAMVTCCMGSAVGVWLVLALPEAVFAAAVPVLILAGAGLVAVQPLVSRWVRRRRESEPASDAHRGRLTAASGAVGVYGGYFGAGQGVILMAVLGSLFDPDLQRSNAAKNLLAAVANVTAAIVFACAGRVAWGAAALVAVGALAGGVVGARVARRLSQVLMRVVVVAVGVAAAAVIVVR